MTDRVPPPDGTDHETYQALYAPVPVHHHRFVHLRTEEEPFYSNDRVREWRIHDVFFCEECTSYKRVHARTEQPHPRELTGRIVTWRMGEGS